jgi:N-acetyl-gamma-glutamyl-phosphate reductase
MKKIKIGIVGGAGYTAGELIRILLNHPFAEIIFVHSTSNAGKFLYEIHSGLLGETTIKFTSELAFEQVNVLFLCSAHGYSKVFLEQNAVPDEVKIIDLSTDFRNETNGFVYGLPELNIEKIIAAQKVANPGCFATAIQLALLPLAKANLLKTAVHVNAITGSTGAGVKPSETSHFSWRNNNISIYKPFQHQHLQEITQSVRQLQPDFSAEINFVPVRGNFTRGIFASAYTDCTLTADEAKTLYRDFYNDAAFTFLTDANPDLKQIVNTNKAIVYLEKHDKKLFIISIIDNLLKGASGQAVQNFNLMFGIDQKCGLQLKAAGF